MELNIYHLYPDVLNLYGDRGNVLCMQRRLEWRGMQANIVNVPIGTKLDAKNCDLIFIGGGQDFEQEVLLDDLKGEKTAELKAAIEDENVQAKLTEGGSDYYCPFNSWEECLKDSQENFDTIKATCQELGLI